MVEIVLCCDPVDFFFRYFLDRYLCASGIVPDDIATACWYNYVNSVFGATWQKCGISSKP